VHASRALVSGHAIQTNNVEADERGYVYLADRANTGLHIVRLAGEAAKIIGN